MCLVVIAYRSHPRYPLIVAANRDEFHARPAQKLNWWPNAPDIMAGRDLQAGGTWLGLHRSGRFATVTNFRDAVPPKRGLASRGSLVSDFLESDLPESEFLTSVDVGNFAGFNLLAWDGDSLGYLSNRNGSGGEIAPGIYGLANATLDTPWPKVERSKELLGELITADEVNPSQLLRLLDDRRRANVRDVDAQGLPFEMAHALSAPFIVLPDYGTRCSTVVICDAQDNVVTTEKRFNADGSPSGQSDFRFQFSRASR